MRRMLFGIVLMTGISSSAVAGVQFDAFGGDQPVHRGRGGNKINQRGIDFWTTGSPPRRFQVLGVMIDTRAIGPTAGSATSSKAVAQKVKAIGGDAVIVVDRAEGQVGRLRRTGVSLAQDGAFGPVMLTPVYGVTTRMLVVDYID